MWYYRPLMIRYRTNLIIALALCLAVTVGLHRPTAEASANRTSVSRPSAHDKYAFHLNAMVTDAELDKPSLTADRPLVLLVWAPDCPACLRHLPYAQALYRKLDLEQVNFVSLAISNDQEDVQTVMDEKGLDFPVMWSGSGKIGDGFEYDGWPTTYVFCQGGKLERMIESSGSAYITDVQDAIDDALK